MQNHALSISFRDILAQRQSGLSEEEVKNLLLWVLPQLVELHDQGKAHGGVSLTSIVYDQNKIVLLPPELSNTVASIQEDLTNLGMVAIELLTQRLPDSELDEVKEEAWNKLYLKCELLKEVINKLVYPNSRTQAYSARKALIDINAKNINNLSPYTPSNIFKNKINLNFVHTIKHKYLTRTIFLTLAGIGCILLIPTSILLVNKSNSSDQNQNILSTLIKGKNNNSLFVIEDPDEKYGFINLEGEVIIEPQFEDANDFSEGVAAVEVDGKWGYIDRKGEFVIAPQFDSSRGFNGKGVAAVEVDGKWGYIDRKGEFVIAPQFNDSWAFDHKGMAAVEVDGKWGFINRDGKFVINPQFDWTQAFGEEKLAAVEVDGKWGFINRDGKFVVNPQFSDAQLFLEGIAAVEVDGKWGFINRDGEIIITPQFDYTWGFDGEGIAAVEVDGKWGFINRDGEFVVNPQFEQAGRFLSGLGAFVAGGKWGFINRDGEIVIAPQFDDLVVGGFFHYGAEGIKTTDIAMVGVGDMYGYIDKNGKWIWFSVK